MAYQELLYADVIAHQGGLWKDLRDSRTALPPKTRAFLWLVGREQADRHSVRLDDPSPWEPDKRKRIRIVVFYRFMVNDWLIV